MNLPNKLTVFRVILIPFFVCFMLADIFGGIDKYIAVGKFMDPLADKLLVSAALICLSESKIPVWIVIIIISRELFISGFRTLAADKGVVLAAGWWGKFKTTFQMIMIIVLIIDLPYTFMGVIGTALIYISLALTIISMVDYVYKNVDVLKG